MNKQDTTPVSEEHFDKAEIVLKSLARKISGANQVDNERVGKNLAQIATHLTTNNRKEQKQAEKEIEYDIKRKQELKKKLISLSSEFTQKKREISKDDFKLISSPENFEKWKNQTIADIESQLSELEDKRQKLSAELHKKTKQAEEKSIKLKQVKAELNDFIKADKKMKRQDKTETLLGKQKKLQSAKSALLQKAAKKCGKKEIIGIDKEIFAIQSELAGISKRIESISGAVPSYTKTPGKKIKAIVSKKTSSETIDIESIFSEIKKRIKGKKAKIEELKLIKNEIETLDEKNAYLDVLLNGEKEWHRKQQLRLDLIKEVKENESNLAGELRRLENRIKDVTKQMREINGQLKTQTVDKELFEKTAQEIKNIHQDLENTKKELSEIDEREQIRQYPEELRLGNIKERIYNARKEISIGNALGVCLSPFKASIRYQTSKHVRRDVIEAERELEKLGILSREYLENIDIFNRKTANGKLLSLDIL